MKRVPAAAVEKAIEEEQAKLRAAAVFAAWDKVWEQVAMEEGG
jgi:hypothetical protein